VAWTIPADDLHRGDVVVLRTEHGTIVKRIALLPGDRIPQVHTGCQWTDLVDMNASKTADRHPKLFRTLTIPAGKVYVLGDNRPISLDSRVYGMFNLDQVERVVFRGRAKPVYVGAGVWVASTKTQPDLLAY